MKLEEEPCIRINTRELDKVPSTKCLPYIYLANSLCYTKSSLYWRICIEYTINI